jgi:hypothetical protein
MSPLPTPSKGGATYQIVRVMIERGSKPGLIRELLETSLKWAEAHNGQDAAALRLWLEYVNFKRPFYAASELSFFWPALKLALGLEKRMTEAPSPNRLANELKFYGLPIVRRSDQIAPSFDGVGSGDWFEKNSTPTEYFICENITYWRDRRLTQAELEEILHG